MSFRVSGEVSARDPRSGTRRSSPLQDRSYHDVGISKGFADVESTNNRLDVIDFRGLFRHAIGPARSDALRLTTSFYPLGIAGSLSPMLGFNQSVSTVVPVC